MSKERLGFNTEREMEHLKKIVNKDVSITLSSRFAKHLIEQAERVQKLEEEYKVRRVEYLEEHIDRLEQQNKRYREGLKKLYLSICKGGKYDGRINRQAAFNLIMDIEKIDHDLAIELDAALEDGTR